MNTYSDNSGASLREEDMPGASFGGGNPTTLTIPALKRWLQCRAAPTKGKKMELVESIQVLHDTTTCI